MKTGGRWEKEQKNTYFLAIGRSAYKQAKTNFLIGLDQINQSFLQTIKEHTGNVLVDSGVYPFVMEKAREQGVPVARIFATPADELEGYEDLKEKYVNLISQIKDDVWGYVEIDLGGKEKKKECRRWLEEQGLNPIPVVHPLYDGKEYCREVFEEYDRVAVGNLSNSTKEIRVKVIDWIHKLSVKHGTFVHLLGYTPDEHTAGEQFGSMDSSTWAEGSRFGIVDERVGCSRFDVIEGGSEDGETIRAISELVYVGLGNDSQLMLNQMMMGGFNEKHIATVWR